MRELRKHIYYISRRYRNRTIVYIIYKLSFGFYYFKVSLKVLMGSDFKHYIFKICMRMKLYYSLAFNSMGLGIVF